MIEIDGSLLEGGGQVLRMSVALSALQRKNIRIFNIRGNRPKPGLRAQHLTGIKLVHMLTGGHLEGCQLHSSEIIFKPNKLKNITETDFEIDIGNNGAISLLVQVCLPVALYRPKSTTFSLKGGTFGDFAPPMIYCQQVFVPLLQQHFGIKENIQVNILQESFEMKGGGHVQLVIQPLKQPLQPLTLDRPLKQPPNIVIRSTTSGRVPIQQAKLTSSGAQSILEPRNPTIENEFMPNSLGNAVTVFIKAEAENSILAASNVSLKKSDTNPQKSGRKAAEEIKQVLDAGVCVDQWAQDQLIIYMALAHGRSRLLTGALTLHTRTAISIAEQLTAAKFTVTSIGENQTLIECNGIGFICNEY